MRIVGTRRTDGRALADQGALARTAAFLKGTPALVPRGVFRFASFDEADTWMNAMILHPHARPNPRTSRGSAER